MSADFEKANGSERHPRASLRWLNWNVEWCRPKSAAGREILRHIAGVNPDIICLTEAYEEFISAGYLITCEPDCGYPLIKGRRKVTLWSKHPWRSVDQIGSSQLPPGRYVAGETDTPLGTVRVMGVCVPWYAAHVSTGRRDRRPWEEHTAYLVALSPLLDATSTPTLVIGDFNQTVPRTRAPLAASDKLQAAIPDRFSFATAGPIAELDAPLIDHVVHTSDLVPARTIGLRRSSLAGKKLSDHDGSWGDLGRP